MASNFFKQIKYLFKTSRHIIKEYGFGYFLNFGFSQAKEQKLDLFHLKEENSIPDIQPPKKKLSYSSWKKQQDELIESSNLSAKHNTEKINIIMFYNRKFSLEPSLNSILEQSHQNFHLVIFTPEDKIDLKFTSNDKIELLQFTTSSYENKLSELNSEFILILNNSVIFEKNAISAFLKFSSENPSGQILYSDEEKLDNNSKKLPFFKPDWSKYLFFSTNYIGSSFLIKHSLLQQLPVTNNIFEYDFFELLLQSIDLTNNFIHIPLILFSNSSQNTSKQMEFNKKTLQNFFDKKNIVTQIDSVNDSNLKLSFTLDDHPKVSIIIPTKDNLKLLSRCIRSLEFNTDYENLEIIIVNNNSSEPETLSYLESLPYDVIDYNDKFNFSKLNNLAVDKATGDYILFLNDDVEALETNWLNEMISLCQQTDVGIVGAKLLYNDNTIQHAGMAHLKNGFYFHPYHKLPSESKQNSGLINCIRECSSVTGACMLIKKSLFEKIGRFDNTFDVYYGDSDLCQSVQDIGFKVIFTPYAVLRHDGSSKIRTISRIFVPVENHYDFFRKWPSLHTDPYYPHVLENDFELDFVDS